MKRVYEFENFKVEYNEQTGAVTTLYSDGSHSPTTVNKDDEYHANLLGITPGEHRLLHEMAHHLLGILYGYKTCPIIARSASGLPMPEDAHIMEWRITALSYFAMRKNMRDVSEWGAIMDIAKLTNPFEIAEVLGYIVLAPRFSQASFEYRHHFKKYLKAILFIN